MKLSFSISSKPSSSRPPSSNPPDSFNPNRDPTQDDNVAAKSQFVTVFDPSKKPSSDAPSKFVIHPIPNNDFWSRKKSNHLPLPTTEDDTSDSTRFMLDTSGNGSNEPGANRYGLLVRSNGTVEREVCASDKREETMKRRFRDVIKDLPDEELPDVPVEGFGAAYLAGYGWPEEKEDGRGNKKGTKVLEHKKRTGTEGLGYVPDAPTVGKKSQKEEIAAGFKSFHEKTDVNVGGDERKPESRKREKRNNDSLRDESCREKTKNKHDVSPSDEKIPGGWLRSHIKVRIISKRFAGGKLYLKKGEVVDVVSPTTCDILIDGSKELLQGVDQKILETALPKLGGLVLVLYGKHKGVFGSLVERDSEKETGLIRDADSHSLIKVLLEQIAEYVGDPSHIEF